MGWLLSIVVGLLIALLGGGVGLVIGSSNVRWYRISSFEGGAGYHVVLLTLVGGLVGLVVGIVSSRVVAGWEEPGFLEALGVAALAQVALGALVLGVCRLCADIAPEIDGHALDLDVEVRAPRGFSMPVEPDEYGLQAYVSLPRGRGQPSGRVDLHRARLVEGRWIIPVEVPLRTSASHKMLRVYLNKENDALFGLPLRSHPKRSDLGWSDWIEAGWTVGKPRPAAEDAFLMRYRVVLHRPPSIEEKDHEDPDREAPGDVAFAALTSESPLAAWLPFTTAATPEARRAEAIARVAERPALTDELAALLDTADDTQAADALRLIGSLPAPPHGLVAPVERFGADLARHIDAGSDITPDADPAYEWAASAAVRFSAWMQAVRGLRERADGDLVRELAAIAAAARRRPDSICLRSDVLRVAAYHLHVWAGIEPLPEDPPPR